MRSMPTTLSPTTLTLPEIERFRTDGYVVVERAFSPDDARTMQDEWWAELSDAHGIRRDDRTTWRQPRGDLKRAKHSANQQKLASPRACGVIDDLLGRGDWPEPRHWGRVLTTFPQAGTWDVPTRIWHSDSPFAWHRDRMNGVQIFSFIDKVAPGGGGTLILAGSPTLLERYDAERHDRDRLRPADDFDRFRRSHPWLAALTGHAPSPPDRIAFFMQADADVDGVPARVVELTGEPGDMVFCHPCIVHCAAPNSDVRPRFMRIAGVMTHEGRARRRGA